MRHWFERCACTHERESRVRDAPRPFRIPQCLLDCDLHPCAAPAMHSFRAELHSPGSDDGYMAAPPRLAASLREQHEQCTPPSSPAPSGFGPSPHTPEAFSTHQHARGSKEGRAPRIAAVADPLALSVSPPPAKRAAWQITQPHGREQGTSSGSELSFVQSRTSSVAPPPSRALLRHAVAALRRAGAAEWLKALQSLRQCMRATPQPDREPDLLPSLLHTLAGMRQAHQQHAAPNWAAWVELLGAMEDLKSAALCVLSPSVVCPLS